MRKTRKNNKNSIRLRLLRKTVKGGRLLRKKIKGGVEPHFTIGEIENSFILFYKWICNYAIEKNYQGIIEPNFSYFRVFLCKNLNESLERLISNIDDKNNTYNADEKLFVEQSQIWLSSFRKITNNVYLATSNRLNELKREPNFFKIFFTMFYQIMTHPDDDLDLGHLTKNKSLVRQLNLKLNKVERNKIEEKIMNLQAKFIKEHRDKPEFRKCTRYFDTAFDDNFAKNIKYHDDEDIDKKSDTHSMTDSTDSPR